jgi:hypothetical protein
VNIEENEFVKAALQLAEADVGRELTPWERELIIAASIGEAKNRLLDAEEEWLRQFDAAKAADKCR